MGNSRDEFKINILRDINYSNVYAEIVEISSKDCRLIISNVLPVILRIYPKNYESTTRPFNLT